MDTRTAKSKPRITNPEVKGVPTVGPELLATAIVSVSEAARALRQTRLSEKALLILLSHESGVPQRTCRAVLDAAESLEKTFVKRKA